MRFCRWILHCLPHDVPLFTILYLYFCHRQFQYFSCNYIFAEQCWFFLCNLHFCRWLLHWLRIYILPFVLCCLKIYIFASHCCTVITFRFCYLLLQLHCLCIYIFAACFVLLTNLHFHRWLLYCLQFYIFAACCYIFYIFTVCRLLLHCLAFTFLPHTVVLFLPHTVVLFLPHTVLHVHILPLAVTVALFVHLQH